MGETANAIRLSVLSPSFSKNETLREAVIREFPQVRFNDSGGHFREAELSSFIGDSNAVIVGLEAIDQSLLSSCQNLKVIAKFGVGLDNIDFEACKNYGVNVLWDEGVNSLSVAEMTLCLMLALCRNIFSTSYNMKRGLWRKDGGRQLSGSTVGIIGLGNVGREVARLLEPFNCRILANDIITIDRFCSDRGIEVVSKETIFEESDIVTIHTPLTEATKELVNRQTIQLMRPDAFLVNTARGGIVNQEELKKALQQKMLAGAALDVFQSEPEQDRELLSLANLICTPHIGGSAREAVQAMGMSAINNLKEFFRI